MKKKMLFFLYLYYICTYTTYAYRSEDIVNISAHCTRVNTLIYTAPATQDLLIHQIYGSRSRSININNGTNDLYNGSIIINSPIDYNILVSDLLYCMGDNTIYNLQGVLINEGEDISENGWTKKIFTKEDIDFIYMREFIIMFFVTYIIFFYKIIKG